MTSIAPPSAPTRIAQLQTPFVLIDGPRLRRNITEMQQHVAGVGAAMRPHFKTHRTARIAECQLEAGALGLTVATAAQLAAVRRELECPVLVSSLLQADPSVAPVLEGGSEVMFAVESRESVELLRRALGPEANPQVMLEVDVGCLRTGVQPYDVGELARIAARLGFRVAGLFSYPGHSYVPGRSSEASEQERECLERGARELARAGFDPRHISGGSTPSVRFARPGAITEYRPGTYVFGDRQQLMLGSVDRSQLALEVVATVLAVHGDRVVLDAGGKALGRDAPRWLEGFGELCHGSAAPITRLYDHHAVVESYQGPRPRIGDRMSILPNNSNSAMALLRSAWITEDGERAEELRPQPDR